VIVPGSTHEWQRNMLKAFLSPLQVNAQGVNIIKDRQNYLPEANSTNAVFRSMEVSTRYVSCNTPALSSGISTPLLTNVTHQAEIAQCLQILGCGSKDQNLDLVPDRGKRFLAYQKRPGLLWISTHSHIKG
jgi:hypothetical protein